LYEASFYSVVYVKTNLAELLEKELDIASWKLEVIKTMAVLLTAINLLRPNTAKTSS